MFKMPTIGIRYPTIATPKIATPSIKLPGGYTPMQTPLAPVVPQMYPTASKGYAPLNIPVQVPSYSPNIQLPGVVDFSKLTPGWGPGAMTAPQFAQPPVLTGMSALTNGWNTAPAPVVMQPPAIKTPVQTPKPVVTKTPAPVAKPTAKTIRTK